MYTKCNTRVGVIKTNMNLILREKANRKLIDRLDNGLKDNYLFSLRPVYVVGQEVRSSIGRDGVVLHGAVVEKPRSTSSLYFLARCRAFLGFK